MDAYNRRTMVGREQEVVQSLNPGHRHRMAELGLMGWRFEIKDRVMAGGGYGWVGTHPNFNHCYAATLMLLIDSINEIVARQGL